MRLGRSGNNEELISLVFCILFSVASLIWNSNFLVRGIASFQRVGDFFSSSLDDAGDFIWTIYNKLESYEQLRQERDSCISVMEDYRLLPQDLERLKNENKALREEISFYPETQYASIKAEVLSVRLHAIFRTIIIARGENDGIRPYMPVVARAIDENGNFIQAVVGKVIDVDDTTAVVEPMINSNFQMGVAIPGTSFWARLNGNSGKATYTVLSFIDQGVILDQDIFIKKSGPREFRLSQAIEITRVGKAVYSSGGGGLFPSGIPVGTIVEEGDRSGSFKTAYLRPYVRFEELKYVTILKKLPEKWAEKWPEVKTMVIDNPYYGKTDYEEENRKPPAVRKTEVKVQQAIPPAVEEPAEEEEEKDDT